MRPHIKGLMPRLSTRITMKMPRAAGNIWLASIPIPKATFCDIGIFDVRGVSETRSDDWVRVLVVMLRFF